MTTKLNAAMHYYNIDRLTNPYFWSPLTELLLIFNKVKRFYYVS